MFADYLFMSNYFGLASMCVLAIKKQPSPDNYPY